MFKNSKWMILLLITIQLTACGNAEPQVDFLNRPKSTTRPGTPGIPNLSPVTTVNGGAYQLKGRISYLETQKELSGGDYKIKGKISF